MRRRLPPLIAALEQTVRRTNSGAADLQSDLAPVLRDAQAAAANLRETSEELRRYPASVLFGGPPRAAGPAANEPPRIASAAAAGRLRACRNGPMSSAGTGRCW